MQCHLHQTHQTIGDFESIFAYLKDVLLKGDEGLHVFPESFLTGYPLQDLCLQKTFIERYLDLLDRIDICSQEQKLSKEKSLLIGGLHYTFDSAGLPLDIFNVIFHLTPGRPMELLYRKRLLPNYDIFDEQKYYKAGSENLIWNWNSKKIALMICEDMWPSSAHKENPVVELKQQIENEKIELDLIVNLSASPFFLGKEEKRIRRGKEISNFLGAPFLYVNRVGGEDEILFDGGSFLVCNDTLLHHSRSFKAAVNSLDIPELKKEEKIDTNHGEVENTWESLFNPSLVQKDGLPSLPKLTDDHCFLIMNSLIFGLQEYARKCGFKKFVVALSGGIDSALVTALTKLGLEDGQEMEAIYMPGFFSSGLSYELSFELCQNLGIKLTSLPIKFFHSSIKNGFRDSFREELTGLADENIQSRLRGALLYARSNQTGAMVINTSNKSELAVGYSTLYGDSVGAISLLGDLYKSEVFQLSEYINRKFNNLIPEEIISRPPTAELREGQIDQDSLPPYDRLDAILEGLLSYRLTPSELGAMGFETEEIEKVYGLYKKSEYKRNQFCPIIKIKAKSFGFGYRVPITEKI